MAYIKKIAINKIEKTINRTINQNTISMGWDVAQHATGVAIIRTTDKYIYLDKIYKITVPKKIQNKDSIDLFLEQLEDITRDISKTYKLDVNMIEDCFFGSNVKTLKTLARFSVLVYDRLRNLTKISIFIMPSSARSKIRFKKSKKGVSGDKLKKEILNYINELLQITLKDHDIADGIGLALAGVIK
ncbi:MAG: crossover junction endodeoxyribonuclease RuvC [Promethearchaeota archaeon]